LRGGRFIKNAEKLEERVLSKKDERLRVKMPSPVSPDAANIVMAGLPVGFAFPIVGVNDPRRLVGIAMFGGRRPIIIY
jgi:hypothetical protein